MDTFDIIKAMIYNTIDINETTVICFSNGSIERANGNTGETDHDFGTPHSMGYRVVSVRGYGFLVHRLIAMAFLPDYSKDLQVDHINGDKSDNRADNLRMATCRQNHRGFQNKRKGGSSEHRGVCWATREGKWVATIMIDYKHVFLGYFKCEHSAALAYNKGALAAGFAVESLNKVNQSLIK